MKIKDLNLDIIKGKVVDAGVDAIVKVANHQLKMEIEVVDEKEENLPPKPIEAEEVLWMKTDDLKAKYIIQAAVLGGSVDEEEKAARKACASVLRCAAELGLKSIAMPALRCLPDFPVVGTAKIMTQEVLKFARFQESSLKDITFCIEDDEMHKTFTKTVRGYIDHLQDDLGSGPYVTVDVIIEVDDGIILIERSNPPYGWALPGGFVDCGESLEVAVAREAKEETDMDLVNLKQLHTYSDPARDPRFHTVSTVFVAQGQGTPQFGDDAKGLKVVKIDDLLALDYAFDHKKVIGDYLKSQGK